MASEPQSFQIYCLNSFLRSYAFTIHTQFDKAGDLRRKVKTLSEGFICFVIVMISILLRRKEKLHGKKQKKMDPGRGTEASVTLTLSKMGKVSIPLRQPVEKTRILS